MNRYSFSPGALVLAALLVPGPGVTLAVPARNANIWDWLDHEPVPSEVQKRSRRRESRHLGSSSRQMTASSKAYVATC